MPDIQGSDAARKLQLRYGLLGGSPSPFLSPELVPVVVVDDLTGFDVLDPTFQRPYQAEIQAVGAPALRAVILVINPANSGVLMTLKRMSGACNVESAVNLLSSSGGTITTAGFSMDSRVAARGACGLAAVQLAGIGAGQMFFELGTAVDSPRLNDHLDFNFVLSPGRSLLITESIINDTMRMNFEWFERLLLAGEL